MYNKTGLLQLFDSVEDINKRYAQRLPCAIRSILYPREAGCDYDCEECIKRSIKELYNISLEDVIRDK